MKQPIPLPETFSEFIARERQLFDFRRWIEKTFAPETVPAIPDDVMRVIGPELFISGQSRGSIDTWIQNARIWAMWHALPDGGRSLILSRQSGWPALPLALRGRTVVVPGFPFSPQGIALTQSLDVGNLEMVSGHGLREFPDHAFQAVVLSWQYVNQHCQENLLSEMLRLLAAGGKLLLIDEGPVGPEFRHHFLFSPRRKKQVLLFVLGFPGKRRRDYFALRMQATPGHPVLKPLEQTRRGESHFRCWKALLTEIQETVTATEHWADDGKQDRSMCSRLREAGFDAVSVFPDPAGIGRHFLHEQALQFSDHPFLHPVTFENICSGIGRLSIHAGIRDQSEPVFIQADA